MTIGCGGGGAMRRHLDHAWRVFATGFSFFVFGLAGLVLGLVVFPVLSVVVRHGETRTRVCRETISWTFRRFVGLMRGLGLLRYDLIEFERLDRRGLLVLANHPSLIDTVFLLGFIRNCTCVVDEHLFENRFTARPLVAAGFIRNSAGTDVFTQCIAALDAGLNVLIFPEGTRTRLDGVIRLRRGAANIAVRAERNVTPVIIRCTPRTLVKGEKWWQVPPRPPSFSLRVGDDIAVQSFSHEEDAPALAVRRLTAHLEQYFTSESVAHAVP